MLRLLAGELSQCFHFIRSPQGVIRAAAAKHTRPPALARLLMSNQPKVPPPLLAPLSVKLHVVRASTPEQIYTHIHKVPKLLSTSSDLSSLL